MKKPNTKQTKEYSVFLIRKLKEQFFKFYKFAKKIWHENPYSIMVFAILILALILRTYRLDTLPSELAEIELNTIKKAKEIAEKGGMWLGADFKEGVYLYLSSIVIKLFGAKVYFFRALSALIGITTVYLTYLFVREWFNKQTAQIAGLLLAFSSWHITLSRNINPDVLQPLFIVLIFFLASKAFRSKKIIYVGLTGLTMGLSLYIDTAFVILPLLLFIAAIYFYFRNKKFLSAYIKEISLGFNVFLATAIPYLVTLIREDNFIASDYSILSLKDYLANFGSLIYSIFSNTNTNYVHNLGSEALLDPFVALLFLAGLIITLFNVKNRKNFFLLSWLAVMLIPVVFAASYIDKVGILMPAIFFIAALALNYLLNEWFTTFPLNRKARVSMFFLVGFFFLLSFTYNYKRYFVAWANSDKVQEIYSKDVSLINE